MAIIPLPSCPPITGINWRFTAATQVNRSEWTSRAKKTFLPAAPRFYADVPPVELTREADFYTWNGFLADLRGRANSFRLPAVKRAQVAGITPLVNGGGQLGYTLVTEGWGAAGLKMRRGMYVTVADQLMRLVADVVANGAGQAMLTFERWLWAAPADNLPLVVSAPTALVSLVDDTTAITDNTEGWDEAGEGSWTVQGFAVEEAF